MHSMVGSEEWRRTFPCGRVALTPKSQKTEENRIDAKRESANLSQYHGARNSRSLSGDCARSAVFLCPNDGPEAAIRKDAGAA
jgi:hypothetical protein